MTFAEAITETIRLASSWERLHPIPRPEDAPMGQTIQELFEQFDYSAPEAGFVELCAHLESLPDGDLFKLRTLMRVGRGDGDIRNVHADLDCRTRSEALEAITGPTSFLAEYLARGLVYASKHGVDLEKPF